MCVRFIQATAGEAFTERFGLERPTHAAPNLTDSIRVVTAFRATGRRGRAS